MPDISMCQGGECPLKRSCYRFIAEPDGEYQTYFSKPPFNLENDPVCGFYWKYEAEGDSSAQLEKE